MQKQQGIIAILDALGAANYSDSEIAQFLDSRRIVLDLLSKKAERFLGDIVASRITTFTFNDTIVIAYSTDQQVTIDDIRAFCTLLRAFSVNSLAQGILFRGAISIGTFYIDDDTNTIMGKAVTDAAAWYDKADWIGITATPQASLLIRSQAEQIGDDLAHLMVDYPVPMKDKSTLLLRAVNWPKAFYVRGLRPCTRGEDPKAKCLTLLANGGVPKGTELKYFNSVDFFDHCIKQYRRGLRRSKKQASS